jgi:OOP family OmpA-OmpF porin
MKNKSVMLSLALAALAAAPLSHAGWYGGFGVGNSKTSNELVTNRESTVVNATVAGSSFDDKDFGFKLYGGYRFNSWIGVEVSYADLGETKLTTDILTSNPVQSGTAVLFRKVSGFGADVIISAPLTERASIFGKVGAVRSRLEANTQLAGAIVFTNGDPSDRERTITHTETVGRYGVGADWMFTPNAGVRLEYERWINVGKKFEIGGSGTTGEADMDFFGVSFLYHF